MPLHLYNVKYSTTTPTVQLFSHNLMSARVYKGHFFVDFGFVWGFVLASF